MKYNRWIKKITPSKHQYSICDEVLFPICITSKCGVYTGPDEGSSQGLYQCVHPGFWF